MSESAWEVIERWKTQYRIRTRPGVTAEGLRQAESKVGSLTAHLHALYRVTNGITFESFKIFPIFDASDPKETWDSIERANDIASTRFLGRDEGLLKRFLIFAEIGGSDCAAIDRTDETIWYQETGDLHQTDFQLFEFVETALSEQAE